MTRSGLSPFSAPQAAAPINLLLVEKDLGDVHRILFELQRAGMFVTPKIVGERAEFEAATAAAQYSAVLSAYELPGWNGIDALHSLRERGDLTPFILVTGELSDDSAAEFVQQGLADYVLKDRLSRLPIALRRALEERQLRDANAQVRFALENSEARARELVDHSTYGVFRVSLEGNFLAANPALLEILGCANVEELSVLNLSADVFRYFQEFAPLLASCCEHGLVHNSELEWRRKDGGLLTVRLNLRYLSLPGPADALEGVVEDITELRKLEEQVRQSQKFESIGQLAGGIAHDFNNVIGAILGWAELGFEESEGTPKIAERFARIREQADRAASLTRELLAFARRQALQPRAIDLNSVNRSLASFLDKVIGKDIEIKFTPGKLRPVKADPTQIEQVLMNLCLNARDAMPNGGRLVIETEMAQIDDSYCRFYPSAVPGAYAVLSVSDTGVGMDSEVRERIFEPFFTTKERGKGTGMGLATVYGIVKQHGGFVHVYSEVRHGSLFRVYLPAVEAVGADGLPAGDTSPNLPLQGSETILLAEDHDSIREMVRLALVQYGYRVLAAEDGEKALKICERESPDLAILDLVMPRLGGSATAGKLLERFPNMRVVFTSGYSESSFAAVSLVPTSRFLQKPYSPSALVRVLREVLGGAESEDLENVEAERRA